LSKKPLALPAARLYLQPMTFRFLLCALLALSLAGCETPYKKSDAAEKRAEKDFSRDPAFQSFVGRLRTAAKQRDKKMLSTMMMADFGYRWDNAPPGETAFAYWDQHQLWGDLVEILKQRFVLSPNGESYMVAPAAVANDPNYSGYRAGIRLVGGSWRFAYFVPAEPAQ
jgi:hypothetical protein